MCTIAPSNVKITSLPVYAVQLSCQLSWLGLIFVYICFGLFWLQILGSSPWQSYRWCFDNEKRTDLIDFVAHLSSVRTIQSLGILTGAQLFSLNKEELRAVSPEEGTRVYSQIMVQKSLLEVCIVIFLDALCVCEHVCGHAWVHVSWDSCLLSLGLCTFTSF